MVNDVLDVITTMAGQGKTMIVVTHEGGISRNNPDRIVAMSDGLIVEQSDPDTSYNAAKSPRAREFLTKILTHRFMVGPDPR